MTKRRQETRNQIPQKPPIVHSVAPISVVEKIDEPMEERIEIHRRCPLCWEKARGVGVSYSKQGCTRYYKCKRTLTDDAPCGFTWSAIVRTEIVRVEHRIVTLEER